jgi:cyclophilin family peptidyl-prolyl cis-trans isomerase
MAYKKMWLIFIMVLSLSVVLLLHSGCSKSRTSDMQTEEGEITKGVEPEETKPDLTETEPGDPVEQKKPEGTNPVVLMETSLGSVKIELFQKEAPVSVKNFLDYVSEGFYDGTIFHRVVPNFVIQGGGFTEDMTKKPTRIPIKNEAKNGISNTRGTVAMARTAIVNSATSQFFINLKDNFFLNHQDDSDRGYGYCVFGRVIEAMDVVDMIGRVPTTRKPRYENVPVDPVIIKSIRVL